MGGPEDHGDLENGGLLNNEVEHLLGGMILRCPMRRKDDEGWERWRVDAVREFSHCIHVEGIP